jgi:AraC family transcriptional regulator, ethanolamine operon transcriptional activator
MHSEAHGAPSLLAVDQVFDDFDAMAASPREWEQEYEQIGRGKFCGSLTQLVLPQMQLGRMNWFPGIMQRGPAPKGTLAFGLPLVVDGTIHVRRRLVHNGEILAATSTDDAAFTATGNTSLVIAALPVHTVQQWLQSRRGIDSIRPTMTGRHWRVSPDQLTFRANALSGLIDDLKKARTLENYSLISPNGIAHIESRISDAILDMIPSAEMIESSHSRARVARAVLDVFRERRDNPPTVTELCHLVEARERTVFSSCMEAFGKPPMHLLLELRLNATNRALRRPRPGTSVTSVASSYGFLHFGRFAATYRDHFDELPSTTLANALGS